jgi:hypothetical protein
MKKRGMQWGMQDVTHFVKRSQLILPDSHLKGFVLLLTHISKSIYKRLLLGSHQHSSAADEVMQQFSFIDLKQQIKPITQEPYLLNDISRQ